MNRLQPRMQHLPLLTRLLPLSLLQNPLLSLQPPLLNLLRKSRAAGYLRQKAPKPSTSHTAKTKGSPQAAFFVGGNRRELQVSQILDGIHHHTRPNRDQQDILGHAYIFIA